MTTATLGAFLKACRDRTQVADVGISSYGQRRVPGLRREEVSMVAGVSVDYYTRLEQGRERHPSPSVLDALARVFGWSDDERAHAFRLAGTAIPPRVSRSCDVVDPELLQLLDDWPMNPAIVVNRTLDVLACNAIARVLLIGLEPSENLVERIFLDIGTRSLYPDWRDVAEATVATLRMAEGFAPQDARLLELVGDLRAASPEFTAMWSGGRVRGKTGEAKRFRHPQVGIVELTYQTFDVRSAPSQQLIVYRAAADTPSAESLKLLGSLAASLA
ncbi:helix-turn-helix transcriptional regulator [Aeromicrobium chenweiae]|uniref:Transcriptional regulator n=1 Tax=Aeromicrobium chenweiae TaxID=2079793 RepID=A0A2S0WLS3_9ACTN|nr:helix-turn-helix transcriptional regulator [Aeromicrobium chenweiae]AWB92275.1 transcriptional regulator [Aeromicrobium chenweiae]TGN31441.1 XRE family transcriptional regulator [Aeromicrobium chenweiae]